MIESNELINLILSLLLFIYFISIGKKYNFNIPNQWIYAIICILLSDTATILEEFIFPVTFNIIEHSMFALACLFLLFGFINSFETKTDD